MKCFWRCLPREYRCYPYLTSHLSKTCNPMHLSPDFQPSPPSFGDCEFAIKTVLCRIALWDCFRRRILARLGVLCNLITANKTSEFPRHSHNAIRQTVPSLTCNPQRVVSSTEQIYGCWTVNLKRFNKYNKKFTQNFKVRRETWVKSWTYTRWLCGRLGSLT